MVFEKITIFEPHLEGARFGPTFDDREEPADSTEGMETETREDESGGRSRVVSLLVASVAVALIATVLARRYVGGDDDEPEQFELDETIEEPAE